MKKINLFLTLLIGFIFSQQIKAENVVFEIGTKDGKASEFDLYPDQYGKFLMSYGGVKAYSVGYSEAGSSWPYALPGPLDTWGGGGYWAGYHPRHFPEIYFELGEIQQSEGNCRLCLDFVGVSRKDSSLLRVEVNGNRFEKYLKGHSGDSLLSGQEEAAPQSWKIEFPTSLLHAGKNKIQLGVVKGHWCMFDRIALTSDTPLALREQTSTLIKDVKLADFEYQDKAGNRTQPVLVNLVQYGKSRELHFQAGGESVVRTIEPGESIQEIYVPAVKQGSRACEVQIKDQSGKLLYAGTLRQKPEPLFEYADAVDLLMGTGNSRWMFKPASTLPLSMVQIAPDNQDETWKAGYEYAVENIMGFNHFSDWTMTGFLMQPTCGELQTNPGREDFPDEGYRSRIDKQTEKAEVGKYSVYMTDTRIKAEVTSTRRAAMQKYIFPERKDARILIDFFTPNEYPHNLVDVKVRKVSDREIEGSATYQNAFTGYTLNQEYTLYFVLQFDKPFSSLNGWVNNGVEPVTGYIPEWNRQHVFRSEPDIVYNVEELSGKGDVGVFLNYATAEGEEIRVRSGVSLVDLQGARTNLEEEISKPFGWDMDAVVQNARSVWNEYLGRIEIETDDFLQKKKFYTNLYRALAAKAVWSDSDGRFTDENERVRRLDNPADCIVSGEYWNTFWDNQPLFNLMAPEISSQWARSAIALYRNSGWFNTDPAGIEHTGVMVAMHVASQLAGAWRSGIRDFDLETAYEGLKKMMTVAPQSYEGGGTVGVENLLPYMKYGYIPQGKGTVSNTLEYAYDDWCVAQLAQILGKEEDYAFFMKRSESWKNLFDTESGFIHPKDTAGNWIEPFDPYHTPGFTEGNAFNYTWFVPQNPEELIRLMGKDRFVQRLNQAMEQSAKANFNAAGDDFANYPINHGNETSMEVAYLFNWAGKPALTQKWVRAIQEQYYGVTPYDAYPGDEDLGQMSSWFVMSALGLFQLDGGCSEEPFYELGSPRYPKATIHLGGKYGRGKTFVIEARNASKHNKYISSASLNGKPVTGFRIPQESVLRGGHLVIQMSDRAE